MVISRTPFRISFLGGGTDYPSWYRQHGGEVLATTIDKYCYLTCRHLPPFFEHRLRVVWSKIENCQTVDEITHPAVRAALRHLKLDRGIELHHDGDLPARSGVGSSSSFMVGLLHSLYALKGVMPSKEQLAQESMHIEQEVLKETVGSQDQVLVAHGGLNHVVFSPTGAITRLPVVLPAARIREFNSHLMLMYTGLKRTASDVAQSYVGNLDANERSLRLIQGLVQEGIAVLSKGDDICRFGKLLHESWQIKRELGEKVTNPRVDCIYEEALSAGAVGGKLIGAGSGGFMVLFVPPSRQASVRDRLKGMIHVPFKIEYSGSQIIFFDPEEDFAALDKARSEQRIDPFREASQELEPDPAS
jgi:D-glycero-alpha-D-manno-heptose-7-phosphate kinase